MFSWVGVRVGFFEPGVDPCHSLGVGGIGQSKERILENLSTFPRENQENEIDINI